MTAKRRTHPVPELITRFTGVGNHFHSAYYHHGGYRYSVTSVKHLFFHPSQNTHANITATLGINSHPPDDVGKDQVRQHVTIYVSSFLDNNFQVWEPVDKIIQCRGIFRQNPRIFGRFRAVGHTFTTNG